MNYQKLQKFQLFAYESRKATYPVDRFIFSEGLNDIVTVSSKPYEFVFFNATGKIIRGLAHPKFYYPQHDVVNLVKTLIKFGFERYQSNENHYEMVYIGAFDMYLIPATHTLSSESLLPVFKDDQKIWITEPSMIGSPTYFIDVFNLTLWLSFIISFLAIGMIITLANHYVKKINPLPHDTFSWFSLITNQGADVQSNSLSIKLLFLSLSVLVIMFHGAFEAFMSSYLAKRAPDIPFNDLSGLLYATDYSICVPTTSKGTFDYVKESLISINQRQVDRLNSDQCPGIFRKIGLPQHFNSITMKDKICPRSKTAIMSSNIYGLFEHEKGANHCRFLLLTGSYFPSYISLPVSPGFKYKEHFDRGMIRLMTAGHINYLHIRYRRRMKMDKLEKYTYDEIDLISINNHQAQLMFWILIFGAVLSCLVFVVEQFVNKLLQ